MTRSIQVEARGEVAELKDNINTMINNLRGTTERNQEQDWLKTNLAEFTRMLQGQRDLVTVGKMLLSELAPLVNAQQGPSTRWRPAAGSGTPPVACRLRATRRPTETDRLGEGLVGQCAVEKQRILADGSPGELYEVHSSLGARCRATSSCFPVLFEGEPRR